MHIIHRSRIPGAQQARRNRAFRKQVARELEKDNLSPERRVALEGKLARLDHGPEATTPGPTAKAAAPNTSGPVVEAVSDSPQESSPPLLSEKQLLRKPHAEILAIGDGEGAEVTEAMTKRVMVDAILAHRAE
ncbi:hypothetical protein N9917_01285 [Deltaproteobacteria bacterium]|nr:hypothetical protein [Deltaproteobacteria bacterium]